MTFPASCPSVRGMGARAWVDESIHLDVEAGGIYVLAAAIIHEDRDLDDIRRQLRRLVPRRQVRLHWHTEGEGARMRVIDTIAELRLEHVVVIRAGVDPKRQERARRKGLERLVFELSQRAVAQMIVESRGPKLDGHDRDLMAAQRGFQAAGSDINVSFARPLEEPMLWIPDAVAGAIALARSGRESRYYNTLIDTLYVCAI